MYGYTQRTGFFLVVVSALASFARVDLATGAAAFPLENGQQWEYIQPTAPAPDLLAVVEGPADFHGRSVIAKSSTVAGFGESTSGTSYYSHSDGDQVLLHGQAGTNSLGVSGSDLYTPPRVLLQLPLAEGASWGGEYRVDHYEEGSLVVSYDESYSVTVGALDESVVVPAGEFTAARVTVNYSNWQETFWLAPDVGMVKWEREWSTGSPVTYLLYSVDFSVPVRADSFSRVKAAYGGE